MGRTLPPLFRTVRRVWQNSAKGWTSAEFCESTKFCLVDILQNSAKCSIFVLQISVKQKRTFLLNSAKTFIFCLADFCGTKLRGWLWLSFSGLSPLSVCGFLLMCCFCLFSACKEKPVAAPPAAFILLIGLPPRQAGGCRTNLIKD